MCRLQPEITLLQLLFVVEVGIMTTLISFYGSQNSQAEEAGRTLTRQAILSYRSTACKLDQRTRLHIYILGCAARRRGCGGAWTAETETESDARFSDPSCWDSAAVQSCYLTQEGTAPSFNQY